MHIEIDEDGESLFRTDSDGRVLENIFKRNGGFDPSQVMNSLRKFMIDAGLIKDNE